MDNKKNNKSHGREELKKFFRNGNIPTENHFSFLIDSMVNKEDDGFMKDEEHGKHLSSLGASKRLLTFYTNIDEMTPLFFFEKHNQGFPGIKLQTASKPQELEEEENCFFLQEGGRMGIGKKTDPKYKLDVKGWVGMEGRMGTYGSGPGKVPADGQWHPIITGLDNCQAFEIVARAGKKGTGKFAIMHAIALSAYGRSSSKIRKTGAHYGFFWNKLNLRWRGTTHNYALELRTNRNFGEGIQIVYTITKLWDDEEAALPEQYYYSSNDD
jgi:hypothetical protein